MTKHEFLSELRQRLSGLPEEDIQKSVDYYSEIIEDRMEDGISEEQAVEAMGSAAKIANQILMDTPLPKLVKAKAKTNRAPKAGEIALLILGAPLWLSLLFAGVVTVFAIYVSIWAVIASLYISVLALGVGAVGSVAGFVALIVRQHFAQAVLCLGTGLMMAGVGILFFFGCGLITKGIIVGSKKVLTAVKSCFIRRGKEE